MSAFNHNIKLIRGLTGLTQHLFAKLIKSKESNVKTYETTEVQCKDFLVLKEITDVAGISLDDLKNKFLEAKDVKINLKMVDKVKGGNEANTIVSEPEVEYKTEPRNTADFLAGRLAEKDLTMTQVEKRIQDAFAFAQKMEDYYLDSKKEKDRLLKIIEDNLTALLTNSNTTLDRLSVVETIVRSDDTVIMNNQDLMSGKEVGTSAKEAGSRQLAADKRRKGKGSQVGARK